MENIDNQIINKDYIGVVLENKNGLLEFSRVPIDRNPFEKSILDMVEDKRYSIGAMQFRFKEEFSDKIDFDYIYPKEYNEAYIEKTQYPKFYEYKEIDLYMNKPIIELEKKCGEGLLQLINDKLGENFKYLVFVFDYLYKNFQKENCLRYIYASDYTKTLSEIKEKDNIKMYSTDTLGFSTFKYVISQDITIFVKSNFGYGSSAYFVCNLKYKNVDILPYTAVINYYYVNWTDFLKCTRDYAPRRDNWTQLFEYVVRISNLIKTDLQGFKKEILGEIEIMVNGIEHIFSAPKEFFMDVLNLKEEDFEKSRNDVYRLVRNVSSVGRKAYLVYPDEKVLAFKVQKITGCLELLDNLKQLKEFIPGVVKFRTRIIELNQLLSSEIEDAIIQINVEIEKMKTDLARKNAEFDEVLKEVHKQDLEKNKYVEKNYNEYKLMMSDKLSKDNDVFVKYCQNRTIKISYDLKNLYSIIQSMETNLSYRESFVEILNKGKERIDRFLNNR
ncbi:MAG: hypothetical protein IKP73_16030 [Bacteroidales bacterium]|nr:hypothetical protein [Bacteroidales bacterium]